jgi:hypothetical protein
VASASLPVTAVTHVRDRSEKHPDGGTNDCVRTLRYSLGGHHLRFIDHHGPANDVLTEDRWGYAAESEPKHPDNW